MFSVIRTIGFNTFSIIIICLFCTSVSGQIKKGYDTVTTLAGSRKPVVYLRISDKRIYKMIRINPSVIKYGDPKLTTPSGPYYNGAQNCSGNIFAGSDRAIAKTHLVPASSLRFKTFDAFYNSGLLISDALMIHHTPAITKVPTSKRVQEETKEITIEKAYVYGIYREGDNDFHIILGNLSTGNQRKLINIEISGLPDQGTALSNVRSLIVQKFGDLMCGDGAFKPVGNPIPVKIEGSLFYDIDHQPGSVGFGIYKPKTSWEIHPVKSLVFL